jgi:hypothetical protein
MEIPVWLRAAIAAVFRYHRLDYGVLLIDQDEVPKSIVSDSGRFGHAFPGTLRRRRRCDIRVC